MARNRRGRRRTRRRRANNNISSLLRNVSTGLRGIQSTRSLTFAPPSISKTTGKVSDSWITKAFPYLSVVMKFVGLLLSNEGPDMDSTVHISSTIQSILIGAEDILYDHPITTPGSTTVKNKTIQVMNIDYSMVRLNHIKIVVSLMGKISERAGRLAAVLIPLNYEKALDLNMDEGQSRTAEVVDFKQLTQKPGAIVSPNLRPLTISRRTSGFTARRAELGTSAPRDANLNYTPGGLPLFELIVGYQDFASISEDPALSYGLDEATLCVEISGSMVLDCPVSAPRSMRSVVRSLFPSNSVTAIDPLTHQRTEIPHTSLRLKDRKLIVLPQMDGVSEEFEKL